jgi:predicted ATP-binding protein involved in virulence
MREGISLTSFDDTDYSIERDIDQNIGAILETRWLKYFSGIQSQTNELRKKVSDGFLLDFLTSKNDNTRQTLDWEEAHLYIKQFLKRQQKYDISILEEEQLHERFYNDPVFRNIITRISETEKLIQNVLEPRDKLQALLDNLFSNKKMQLKESNIIIEVEDGNQIELANLSSGEKQILYILMNALEAEKNSFMIDEPEISMHMDWQSQLVSSIQQINPEAQLILATHSPEIMVGVSDDKIFAM